MVQGIEEGRTTIEVDARSEGAGFGVPGEPIILPGLLPEVFAESLLHDVLS
jgi:hypothetical protein